MHRFHNVKPQKGKTCCNETFRPPRLITFEVNIMVTDMILYLYSSTSLFIVKIHSAPPFIKNEYIRP